MHRFHYSTNIVPNYEINPVYKSYTLQNFKELPQIRRLSEEQVFDIEVVGHVLPFKTSSYVVEELIDWSNIPNDPMFVLNFPQRDMLKSHHFNELSKLLREGASPEKIKRTAYNIRLQLNPHPAGQMDHNIPSLKGKKLCGIQHKYRETVLFFPLQGQTCHAYCTFCFRWPQFIGINKLKFGMREIDILIRYVRRHPEVTDILFTGGDPLVMTTKVLTSYIDPLIEADLPNVQSIRIGTKSLTYWPYRFLTDPDADELLALFEKVVNKGKHLAFMAHLNHPNELKTEAVKRAIARIRNTGAQIRTQSPLLAHINDSPDLWTEMWNNQVRLGCIPYYMFIARDTGAQHFFRVPLGRAWQIYQKAYQNVSGLSRTVRGPSMSAAPGKVEILGVNDIAGEKVFVLRMLQGRNPDWAMRPFFAAYDKNAVWLDKLRPAFGKKRFFFQEKSHPKAAFQSF